MRKVTIHIIFLLFSGSLLGQNPFKGKAKAIFWEGETLYKNGDLPNAINQWKLIYETEEEYALLNYYLGDSYFQLKQYSQAIWYLNKATIINDAYYEIAYSHLYQGEYLAAATAYGNYTWRTESKFSYHEVIQLSSNIANYAQFVNNQEVVNIINLGKTINTADDEYVPLISSNEELLLFTSRRDNGEEKDPLGRPFEDVYYSNNTESGFLWSEALEVEGDINTALNDACVGLSPDGNTLFLFRTNKNLVGGDLYESILINDKWTTPVIMSSKINGTLSVERSASISLDGLTFYFSSNRDGGFEGFDLYRVSKLPNGEWSRAINLGWHINTPLDEDSPFIHPDGKTLYFSSKGHKNMGGFDIFKAEYKAEEWINTTNLGAPTNSSKDDIHFTISANEKHGYYSSSKQGGFGGQDIYAIDYLERSLHQSVIPATVIIDEIPSFSEISLVEMESGELVGFFTSHPKTGKFIFLVNPNVEYELIIEGESFEEYAEILIYTVDELLQKQRKLIKLNGERE
jgi:YHS domain-containing protein